MITEIHPSADYLDGNTYKKIRQNFCTRWHKEYLNGLNIRTKWTRGEIKLRKGTLVIIREDNLPSLQWKMGRIVQNHPGADGIVRTISIKTAAGIVTRNIRNITPLPINNDSTS